MACATALRVCPSCSADALYFAATVLALYKRGAVGNVEDHLVCRACGWQAQAPTAQLSLPMDRVDKVATPR